MDLRADCEYIMHEAIRGVLPGAAVKKALSTKRFDEGRIVTVAIGKAAYTMAEAAKQLLGPCMNEGVVITKYGHAQGEIEGLSIFEAGHPVPDQNAIVATEAALAATRGLNVSDTVLFLLSGGGSALFESPLIPLAQLQEVTGKLLACGADIVEMNTIRKRLSRVKGGRFAQHCLPARVFAIVLSDIVGDPLDMIASGPAFADASTCADADAILKKYDLSFPSEVMACLKQETPKHVDNVETVITGSVRELCLQAAQAARNCGYEPIILTDSLGVQAREAGAFLAAMGRYHQNVAHSTAFIVGGETVVRLTGNGKGGRNQELALAAAEGIQGLAQTAVFSFGSDGTDGPTDAAGGFVDDGAAKKCAECGISISATLQQNDAYHALKACGGLLMTGATGTNVNDAAVLLIKR